jgi:hypothetical protein
MVNTGCSSLTAEPGARQTSPSSGAATVSSDVVPPDVRRTEQTIEKQARRLQAGVRAGIALDPELVLSGVHTQLGPFFNRNAYLRPSVELAFAEVTALFGLRRRRTGLQLHPPELRSDHRLGKAH